MRSLADELRERLESVRRCGEPAREKFEAAGKLLPRDRVEQLLDPDSPRLEVAPLAGWEMYDGESPGGSHVDVIGRVAGVECMVMANDATVKGGAFYPISV